ncbi:MAG: protein-glutamate methylesterase/protein-glutamine glutaminase [Terrimicrobiaceae bacterium]|jgi:two-component system chemotaxis response regulator CheB
MVSPKVRVLIVDDSAIFRRFISSVLAADPGIEVVGAAADPYEARGLILSLKPHVLTLDIEMPKMDGITFLKILASQHPVPAVVFSSLSPSGSQYALQALESGAVDVLAKPANGVFGADLARELVSKVKAAASANRIQRPLAPPSMVAYQSALNRTAPGQIILIGSSTGGTEALKDIIPALPVNMPPICIAQHIPSGFSAALARRLNDLSSLEVREAAEGDVLARGTVLIAPGDQHMVLIKRGSDGYAVRLKQGPKVNHCRPSVDVLFESAAPLVGHRAVAGILTGMGDDGARGLLALRNAGCRTFAQDEKTCVVYGMPRKAFEAGAVQKMVPLEKVAEHIVKSVAASAASA